MRMLLLAALLSAGPSWATEKHIPKNPLSPPPTTNIYQSGEDHGVEGLLIGAGVAFWLMHRRAKHRAAPPVTLTCPEPNERERRIEQACGK